MNESHIRAMILVSEDPKKWINKYSRQFQSDFLWLLHMSHGEKLIHANRFYQEYIADKQHIHLHITRWSSLTDFVKYFGREGICEVEDKEDGLFIRWIYKSLKAIRRREALQRAQKQQQDEAMEQREVMRQVERAQQNAPISTNPEPPAELEKERWTGFKVNLKLSESKPDSGSDSAQSSGKSDEPVKKPRNVFATMQKKPQIQAPQGSRKISEVERVMEEDMKQKKRRLA